jgi:hypothetical protein
MNFDPAPKRFSTEDVPERDRLSRWREEFGRAMVRSDIEPFDPAIPFRAEAILQTLPGVRTGLCDGTAARYERTPAMAAQGDDEVGLIVNLGPKAIVAQRDDSLTLATRTKRRVDSVAVEIGTRRCICISCHWRL